MGYPSYEKYKFNSAVDDLLNGAKCSEDMFPRDLTYYEIRHLLAKICDETFDHIDWISSDFNKRVFKQLDNTIGNYYNTARRKRAISYVLDGLRKSDDIFTRDMNAQELRSTYHNLKDGINTSYASKNALSCPYASKKLYTPKYAHYRLVKYYNTARAELGLPPID